MWRGADASTVYVGTQREQLMKAGSCDCNANSAPFVCMKKIELTA